MAVSDETAIRAVPGSHDPTGGIIDLDAVENPIVRAGIAHWRAIRGARKFPARADLTPRGIAGLLRNISLVRVVGDGEYEFRIVGDAHVIAHGFSLQGLRLGQVDRYAPGYGAMLKMAYDPVVQRRVAFALRGFLLKGNKNKQFFYAESAFLPLGPDDQTVDHILNVSAYIPRDSRN